MPKRKTQDEEYSPMPTKKTLEKTSTKKNAKDVQTPPVTPKKKTGKIKLQDFDHSPVNLNPEITKALDALSTVAFLEDKWRGIAYKNASAIIKAWPEKITSGKAAEKLEHVGKSISTKIDEILTTGHVQALEKSTVNSDEVSVLQLFETVSGVGPQKARNWYNSGTRTLKEAANRDDLTHHQRVGLKYHDDLMKRIPREECDQWNQILTMAVQKIEPKWICHLVGSYRRGEHTSGDLDLMVTSPDMVKENEVTSKQILDTIVDALTQQGIIVDFLSHGHKKFQGVAHIPDSDGKKKKKDVAHPMRQLDISIVPMESYWTGILHHTGSQTFNQYLRTQALKKQFHLSEYELINRVTNERVHVNSEQEIFEIIGEEYKEPHERGW